MSNIVPLTAGQMPAIFAARQNLPDMNAAAQQGLLAGFAVVGYKGKNWRLKYRGEDELLKDARNVPIPTLAVVIVGLSPNISKQWYDKKFSEGDNEAPDCFSVNGIAPDPASPRIQCASCAACPQNVWGSRVTEANKKAKACQDSRRIAVVPAGDIDNETYGGPMMLRVPPMSLANLAKYTNEIGRYGAQPFMVVTELGFDYDMAYPCLTFSALGWLDDAQAVAVADAMENPLIERMLEVAVAEATADPAAESALAGGRPAGVFTPTPAPTPAPGIDYAAAARAAAEAKALVEAQAEEARVAVETAKAQAQARAVAQAQAQAQALAQQAAPAKRSSAAAFGSAPAPATVAPAIVAPAVVAPAIVAPAVVTAMAATPALAAPLAASGTAVVLKPAPDDMNQAIDDLLAS